MRRGGAWLLAFALLGAPIVSLDAGCATRTTTVTTERSDDDGDGDTETTVTRETETVAGPTGVLSTTIDLVGAILALPFRIVGAVIGFIF
jgi:hypothetical protein